MKIKFFNKVSLNYIIALISISLTSFFCLKIQNIIGYQSVALILLLNLSLLPLFLDFGSVLFGAFLSAILWNFLFIPPKFTLYIEELEDFLMFVMYFIIAITTGVLTTRVREHKNLAVQREKKTSVLYSLTKDLSAVTTVDLVIQNSIKHLDEFFKSEILFILTNKSLKGNPDEEIQSILTTNKKVHSLSSMKLEEEYLPTINKCLENKIKQKYKEIYFYPIYTPRNILGVIGIKGNFNPDIEETLENFIYQIASALEREYLNDKAKETMLLSESDRLYKTLFNSISHELRTPIATIIGATSSLLDEKTESIKEIRSELINEIYIAGERLNRLVGNLLDMSRLESGKLQLNLDWYDINDLIGKVISELKFKSSNHIIKLELEEDLPLSKFDFILLEQAVLNIVINSINYTPIGSTIKIKTSSNENFLIIEISDNGEGLPENTINKIFDKFYRSSTKTGGTGLGLSIAKGFIEAHNGNISVKNLESKGLKFTINLPIKKNTEEVFND